MANIEIDGQALQANSGEMIIEIADRVGSYIPRFCYHKKLSIAANCRMCLVEVEGAPKALPACATPVADGMKVMTRSSKALQAQRDIMEFLLINHPLDCPVCDQGGQCELQDLAMGYGEGVSQYYQGKRSVQDKDIGPLIDTEMTRCIHCTRCIRFGTEIAGVQELGLTGRGENTQVGTYVAKLVSSEVSGNVIDLCPVGALNAKPSAKQGRAWHLTQHTGVALHDCLASPVYWHTDRDDAGQSHIVQAVPRQDEKGDHTWISDRDRFSYLGLKHPSRLTSPMIKKKDVWCEVSWQEALTQVAAVMESVVAGEKGGDDIAALASPNASMESLYMCQKLWRALGSSHLDHRVRRRDFSQQFADDSMPGLSCSLDEMSNMEVVWLVDCDIPRECPVLGLHVREAVRKGGKLLTTNTADYVYPMDVDLKTYASSDDMHVMLASVLKACYDIAKQKPSKEDADFLKKIKVSNEAKQIAEHLFKAERVSIVSGLTLQSNAQYGVQRALLHRIASVVNAALSELTHGVNAAGAAAVGFLPHRGPGGKALDHQGMDAASLSSSDKKILCLLDIEPEFDCLYGADLLSAMDQSHLTIACTSFVSDTLKTHADILLPIAAMGEESGNCINLEGRQQQYEAAADLPGYARPAWKIFRVLGSLLSLSGFDQTSIADVREEMQHAMAKMNAAHVDSELVLNEITASSAESVVAEVFWPIYRVDPVVRRSPALQEALPESAKSLHINITLAASLGVKAGDNVSIAQNGHSAFLPCVIDAHLAEHTVRLPLGLSVTRAFGPGEIDIQKGEAHA